MNSFIEIADPIHSTAPPLITHDEALAILNAETILTESLHRAAEARKEHFSDKVRIHILDNIKNGRCAEDCGYCAQRSNSQSGIDEYGLKNENEILENARQAKQAGAYRFCMVTAGTAPSIRAVEDLSRVIERIQREIGIKVCLSAGLLDAQKANRLKSAGLDRYNHNLNTARSHYPEICDSHTYDDRLETLRHLSTAGIAQCSGVIVGMGETNSDLVEVAFALKANRVISIPVNFFIPIPGHTIKNPRMLTPDYCLRALIVFRLINPDSEIRLGAGREGYLRGLQPISLLVANSLFASGYLNVKGSDIKETIQMITDMGLIPQTESGVDLAVHENAFLYAQENFPEMYKSN